MPRREQPARSRRRSRWAPCRQFDNGGIGDNLASRIVRSLSKNSSFRRRTAGRSGWTMAQLQRLEQRAVARDGEQRFIRDAAAVECDASQRIPKIVNGVAVQFRTACNRREDAEANAVCRECGRSLQQHVEEGWLCEAARNNPEPAAADAVGAGLAPVAIASRVIGGYCCRRGLVRSTSQTRKFAVCLNIMHTWRPSIVTPFTNHVQASF